MNKVSVGEPADGTSPYQGVNAHSVRSMLWLGLQIANIRMIARGMTSRTLACLQCAKVRGPEDLSTTQCCEHNKEVLQSLPMFCNDEEILEASWDTVIEPEIVVQTLHGQNWLQFATENMKQQTREKLIKNFQELVPDSTHEEIERSVDEYLQLNNVIVLHERFRAIIDAGETFDPILRSLSTHILRSREKAGSLRNMSFEKLGDEPEVIQLLQPLSPNARKEAIMVTLEEFGFHAAMAAIESSYMDEGDMPELEEGDERVKPADAFVDEREDVQREAMIMVMTLRHGIAAEIGKQINWETLE